MRNDIEREKKRVSATPSEERSSPTPRCTKILEYVKNRNRVAPARIRLADCDFFVVGPRRTLRVLVPRRAGDLQDETAAATPPRLADEELPSFRRERSFDRSSFGPSKLENFSELENESDELQSPIADKNKIIKSLEEYIERLLREVLCDTMRLFNDPDHNREGKVPESQTNSPNHNNGGYTNQGYQGSPNDPDSLESPIDPKSSNENEIFDCTDSGINSVETTDLFQTSSQEVSLEQSLMEIMDAKFSEVSCDRDRTIVKKDSIHDPTSLTSSPDVTAPAPEEDEKRENVGESERPEDRPESPPCTDQFQLSKTETLREKLARRFGRKSRRQDEREKTAITTENDDATAPPSTTATTTVHRVRHSRKPLIVFLHGFGSSAQVFQHQLEYFSNLGYPCVAPELLGHGMSSAPDRPRDYRFDKLLGDLETVLEHYQAFGPGNKCVLVAHNYGCSFASALASKYERNVDRLVLISGGGPTPLAPPSTEGPGRCCLRALLGPLLVCGLRRDILYSARGRQHPYRGSESLEQRPSHMRYVLEGMIWPEGDCVFHRRITVPTLLIHGLRDDEVSLVQECQMERTIIKAFLDAIPTAGHTPMIDCPERVNHAIHCFVDLCKRKRR